MNELLAAAGAVSAVSAAAAVIWKVLRMAGAITEGLRCQLRTDLLRTYYRHKDEKQIRQYEIENFEHNFAAYTALGGNSFVGKIHEEVCSWEVVS